MNWQGYQNGQGDLAQHLSGWYAFVNDGWHFPLLKITLLDYPHGTTLSLTDSLPFFAFIFKPFRDFFPPLYNYFSLLFIFCYFTQALAAMLLAMSLKQKNILAVSCLILFALSAPILSIRLGGEDSLAFQSILIFALSLYFFNHDGRLSLKSLQFYFGLLIAISLLIHPYLTAMSYPFYLAALYEYKKRHLTQRLLKSSLIMHGFIALEFFIFGLGAAPGYYHTFGYCTMNLLAPFYGGILSQYQSLIGYPGQDEGFAYLGVGLNIMLLSALALTRTQLKHIAQSYFALFALMIFFFVYAIYGNLFLGHIYLLTLPLPHSFFLTDTFETNGRFFWPCFYILLSFGIATLLKKAPRTALIFLPLLTILQLFDTAGYTHAMQNRLTQNMSPPTSQQQAIAQLMQKSKIIIYSPTIKCKTLSKTSYLLLIQTQLLAAQNHIPINTAYTAHFMKTAICEDDTLQFQNLYPQLLISETGSPSPAIQTLLQTKAGTCQIIENGYYCLIQHPAAPIS